MRTVEILQVAGALLGALASVAMGLEQRLVRRLRLVDATQPDRAIDLRPGTLVSRWRLSRLREVGAVIEAPSGGIFLDEPVYRALRSRRRVRALTLVAILLVVVLGMLVTR